jgi:hypothetical protein
MYLCSVSISGRTFFFSNLRQFKLVKPVRQPGEKKQECKIENNDKINWEHYKNFCIRDTIKIKFHKKRVFIEIFLCLFCNFRGSKPTRTRTQNREKQRNGQTTKSNGDCRENTFYIDYQSVIYWFECRTTNNSFEQLTIMIYMYGDVTLFLKRIASAYVVVVTYTL